MDTSWGISVISTFAAEYHPIAAPKINAPPIHPKLPKLPSNGKIKEATIARPIPKAAVKLPFLAVLGLLSPLNPKMTAMAPIKYIKYTNAVISYFFFLNIANIRFVTANPPTILIIAITIARAPSDKEKVSPGSVFLRKRMEPTKTIPLIAFAPDINGV